MIVWPWWSFARSVLAAGNSHACSWQFEMTCTVTQQVDGPTQKWKDTKRWWHSPEGPSIVPWMWPPVLWPEADCHLEHLSIHHVCHHPQETWEAESRTAEFFLQFLRQPLLEVLWKLRCRLCCIFMSPVLLRRCVQRKGVTESSLFYIVLKPQLREKLKKTTEGNMAQSASPPTLLLQNRGLPPRWHLTAWPRQASGERKRRDAFVGNARVDVSVPNRTIFWLNNW